MVGLAALGLLLIAGPLLAFIFAPDNKELLGIVVSVLAAVVTPLVSGLITALWRHRRLHGQDSTETVALAADDLAMAIRRQWEKAATELDGCTDQRRFRFAMADQPAVPATVCPGRRSGAGECGSWRTPTSGISPLGLRRRTSWAGVEAKSMLN